MTELNEQRRKVFLDRYAVKNAEGEPVESTVEEMWDRVAGSIGQTDDERKDFRRILEDFKFVPGGRILAGAGTDTEVTYYNCYVIPIETKGRRQYAAGDKFSDDKGSDSREAILDTISVMVDIMSRGGGVGINWSTLRPKGTHLSRVNGTTSGPVSWMDVASHAVQTVTQGGSRRGAAMFMLDDWHPDVLEFIDAKRNLDKITGANVSVAVSDALMAAVEADGMWVFGFPDTKHPAYDTEWDGDIRGWGDKGYPVKFHSEIRARDLWAKIAESAWHNGEPGVVFLDRYNELSTGKGIERIICVNPCGEQGLGAYSVCNLGSMNLDAYVKPVYKYKVRKERNWEFDWEAFIEDSETAVTFLDNVVDLNFYFLPENKYQQMRLRRIGLGVMGLADALIALGLRYGSEGAVAFTERVFSVLRTASIRRSCVLAQNKGKAPAWDLKETFKAPYFADFIGTPLGGQIIKYGLRNMFLLTQAPTGSTSILAGVNSGIEPYFAFEYTRKDRTGTHRVLASAMEKYRDEAVRRGPEWVTSNDVTVEEHILMQAAVQKYVDSSVSKTINGPNSHTVADVQKAYELAYSSGLKGLAYFRDGNGRDQVLYKEEPKDVEQPLFAPTDELDALYALVPHLVEFERPSVLRGSTHKVATRAGSAYVTVNRDSGSSRPVEVFFNVGKAGSEVAALSEALGRLASLALRKGATLGGVANQLAGVGGNGSFNRAIPAALSIALTEANTAEPDYDDPILHSGWEDIVLAEPVLGSPPEVVSGRADLCPECDNLSLVYQEGCSKCPICGYAAC